MKKLTKTIIILLAISGFLSFASPGEAASSLDKEMNEMVKRGILTGYIDGTLGGKDQVTRAQFAAFISRALNLPNGNHPFKDVGKSNSLKSEISKVYSAGIMKGVASDRFAPNDYITRAQVVLTLQEVVKYSGMDTQQNIVNFTDKKEINSGVLKALYSISSYKMVSGYDDGSFKPNGYATREQAAAFIYRFLQAKESEKVDVNTYYLGTAENDRLAVQTSKGYASYTAALSDFKSNKSADAILKGNTIVTIKEGVVFGNKTSIVNGEVKGDITLVYQDRDFSKQLTYIERGREMRFIAGTDQYAEVQVGGTIGFVKPEEVDFLPAELVKRQNYYTNSNGELMHYQYNYVASRYEAPYSIGPAPSGMANGAKYSSLDGVHFKPVNGGAEITHYPYFQYQSIRSKTSYTGDELERYIVKKLAELGETKNSKLLGQGKFIIEMQEKYNINGLFILAAAMHESKYGTSDKAHEKNNLFGVEVFDNTSNDGTVYSSPAESIQAFAGQHMDQNYADTLYGGYYNGAAPGNKTTGINVRYASDPEWGAKVAGHMYRIDAALGKKDLNKYKLGITNFPGVNVRTAPGGKLLYEFGRNYLGINEAFGYPVIITGKQSGSYKIVSDLAAEDDKYNGTGWVVEEFITPIN